MLEDCKSAQERWGGVSEIIDRWLQERQELLVDYCALSSALTEPQDSECGTKLRKLCQIMVDYVSAGHFEVYEQLMQEAKEFDDTEGLRAASGFYKTIDGTTEDILDFNDKYQETDDLETLNADLSKVGEWLATRFEAEDSMIEVLHVAHKDQVA
ncbi:sigma D regulator [Marinagarivorans cellulosilyticus]|uniref:Regulator of sigma D n=1 Tax=Marinagarivorans cellulosilyticus TaxID=2721545 RepID=A0AAN1WJX2_9GAMM|nr:sigma D regulator [Marinagarivorans cellulosilyticus]BCD99006.1 regulator of sigma D [Marinagarivorans cellulosilyticus]